MAGAITTTAVKKAAAELAGMRRALTKWMKYRAINDQVLAGTLSTKKPGGYAQRVVGGRRDLSLEQDLAQKLHALLSEVMPDAALPSPDVRSNRNAAMQLAQIAITGNAPLAQPSAVGSAAHPWLWPVLIVGGLLLAITTAIKSAADVAAQKEQDACIEAGACTDYGFWLKAGGITMLVWFAWRELGLGDVVKSHIKKRSA